MAGVWARSERARCTHPGWARLEGWDTIEESWRRIFAGPQTLQFILTEVDVTVTGDAAWVVLDENLLGGAAATVSTVNIFVRRAESTWNLVNHHGSSVIG
jgi:ketosteroid isomerase-like protein